MRIRRITAAPLRGCLARKKALHQWDVSQCFLNFVEPTIKIRRSFVTFGSLVEAVHNNLR